MFRLPESERKKLEGLRTVLDPLLKVKFLMKDSSFIYNLYLSVATGKYGYEAVDFEKVVNDPLAYPSPSEKDRIIKLITQRGKAEANDLLNLLFKVEKGKWVANGWEIDKNYLSIKKRMWFKFHNTKA